MKILLKFVELKSKLLLNNYYGRHFIFYFINNYFKTFHRMLFQASNFNCNITIYSHFIIYYVIIYNYISEKNFFVWFWWAILRHHSCSRPITDMSCGSRGFNRRSFILVSRSENSAPSNAIVALARNMVNWFLVFLSRYVFVCFSWTMGHLDI